MMSAEQPAPLPAGWGYPTDSARKKHHFAEGEVRSSCGSYGRYLPFPLNPTSPAPGLTCTRCARRAATNLKES